PPTATPSNASRSSATANGRSGWRRCASRSRAPHSATSTPPSWTRPGPGSRGPEAPRRAGGGDRQSWGRYPCVIGKEGAMRIPLCALLALIAVSVGLTARPALSGQGKGNAQDEAAIQKQAEAFIEAFNKGDAKALAAFWTPDGDY